MFENMLVDNYRANLDDGEHGKPLFDYMKSSAKESLLKIIRMNKGEKVTLDKERDDLVTIIG